VKPLHQRIAGHLYSSSRALGLTSIAIALNESQSKVDAALRTMRKNGELVLNGWSKYRLSDDVRVAMDESEREPQNERAEKTGGNRSEPLELPEVDDSAVAAFADRVAAEVVAKSLNGAVGPTDAELDAIEEEVQHDQDARPTNGLRIEQVARELVALEDRRQELLEELRGLV